MNPSASQVVIVGGGFAGLFAVRALRRAPVQVTLIDRAEHHLFQPMLYQCATGIDAAKKVLARRPMGEEVEFGYDYLILAAAVRQSYFGHDE